MQRFKKYAIGAAGMLALVVAVVLATGSGSAVAAQISSVFVTNDAAHAVPVHANNTDANGNLRVHEQGTASVQGTVNVNQVPVTTGNSAFIRCSGEGTVETHHAVATVLAIHMDSGLRAVDFLGASSGVISFEGPSDGGPSNVILPLTRPLQFEAIGCASDDAQQNGLFVSWAGNN
jgi:hypothetical protein